MNVITEKSYEDLKYWKLGSDAFGKPSMYVHSFLWDGLLIDTGQPRVEKEFSEALQTKSIDKIILTHHHEDHSGNVEAIKKLKNINAYASPLCCTYMVKPSRVEPARWMTWGQNTPAQMIPLKDKSIHTDKYTLDIIDTPGHAADQISLYNAERGWLFSGDIFIHDYVKIFMRDEKIDEQISSIQKLLRLDFDVLLCNHQPILTGGKKRLENKLQFLLDFYGNIEKLYHKGYSEKSIMQDLGLKELRSIVWMSFGQLSMKNMVRSTIHAINNNKTI